MLLTCLLIALLTSGYVAKQYDSDELKGRSDGVESRANYAFIIEHPYFVGLDSLDKCGAALVTLRHAVTNSFCALQIPQPGYVYVGGSTDLTSQKIEVAHIVYKEGWSPWLFEGGFNNIGVVHLAKEVTVSELVRPIKLPRNQPSPEGWNFTTVFRRGTSDLAMLEEERNMYVYPAAECYRMSDETAGRPLSPDEKDKVNEAAICAVAASDESDAVCEANEGAPVVKDDVVYGVLISRFDDCVRSGNFFANIVTYLPWIDEVIEMLDTSPPDEFQTEY